MLASDCMNQQLSACPRARGHESLFLLLLHRSGCYDEVSPSYLWSGGVARPPDSPLLLSIQSQTGSSEQKG